MMHSTVQLNIQRIEDTCVFHLLWGQGQQCQVQIPYPKELDRLYQDWQRAYLNFYQGLSPTNSTESPDILRGKVVSSGAGTAANTDWQADLAELQQRLQLEFHRWLQQPALDPIRQPIIKSAVDEHRVDVLIACTPLNLARLPWESWELGVSLGIQHRIRIARTALNMTGTPSPPRLQRPRILVILGDDQGLNFQREIEAIAPLRKQAEVHFIGWTPERSVHHLKDEIQTALIDKNGWDILFFAGHSNEKPTMGGEFSIAPNGWIQLDEIKPLLAIAKQNGLQFALFNSCSGLNIAESLMNLGLSQVVIMREPIHNSVAEAFFESFAQSLAQHHDVHDSLLAACQDLKTQKALTFPSADLVPSFFRRPQTDLFRIAKRRWRNWFRKLKPSKYEAIALPILLLMSLRLFVGQATPNSPQQSAIPIQETLLDQRVLMQARYRHWTGRDFTTGFPTVTIIQIDAESLQRADIVNPSPIPHGYVNQIVEQVVDQGVTVVGLDYLLDSQQADQPILAETLTQAQANGVQFVFAKSQDDLGNDLRTLHELSQNSIHAQATRALGDDIHVPLIIPGWTEKLAFAHWLALLSPQCDRHLSDLCQANLQLPLKEDIEQQLVNEMSQYVPRLVRSPLAGLGYSLGLQKWFHPITDFSIPPQEIYTVVPAWQLLEFPHHQVMESISNNVVIIAAGSYDESGMGQNPDSFSPSAATRYWFLHNDRQHYQRRMTGGEHHAYLIHHTLTQRWVIPIPHLWMVLAAAIVGKGTVLVLQSSRVQSRVAHLQRYGWFYLLGGTVTYTLLSLELYLSPLAISLPIILPIATYWLYVVPCLMRQ